MKYTIALLVAAIAATGCAVKRPYQPPIVAPAQMTNASAVNFSSAPYDPRWWQQFEDPVLDRLEAVALDASPDVRIAVERLQQARAIFSDVSYDRYPTVGLGASVDVREQAVPGFVDKPIRTDTYQAGFDAFWELDFFGRVRSAIAAASANAESYGASLDDARVIVSAEVARNYFELRGLQRQLEVAERSLTNQRETLRLTAARRDAGIGEEQDVASASARVAFVEASIPPIRTALSAHEHRLAVLTGNRPGELAVDLSPRPYPPLAKELPLGDSSTFLNRRPDVRAAERQLAAATAREGVAAAELYPRITVTGMLGLLAGRGSVFGTSDSRAWAVTPALSWTAFNVGSARARLRGAAASTRESLAVFDQTVLRALEETSNALVAYREEQQRLVSLADQSRESERAAAIARARYREGVSDFLVLLDAERTQLQAEHELVAGETDVFVSVVAIYKALGGVSQ